MEDQNILEVNKAFILHHFEEFVNKKNSAIALVNFSDDFLDHDEMGGPTVGPEAAKKMMEGAYKIWPDLHVSVEDIIAEGDKVMVRNIWRGTFANGKKIEFHGFVLWKISNGKIVERWATVSAPAEEKDAKLTWLK
jgi:predicted ester cyclase